MFSDAKFIFRSCLSCVTTNIKTDNCSRSQIAKSLNGQRNCLARSEESKFNSYIVNLVRGVNVKICISQDN